MKVHSSCNTSVKFEEHSIMARGCGFTPGKAQGMNIGILCLVLRFQSFKNIRCSRKKLITHCSLPF